MMKIVCQRTIHAWQHIPRTQGKRQKKPTMGINRLPDFHSHVTKSDGDVAPQQQCTQYRRYGIGQQVFHWVRIFNGQPHRVPKLMVLFVYGMVQPTIFMQQPMWPIKQPVIDQDAKHQLRDDDGGCRRCSREATSPLVHGIHQPQKKWTQQMARNGVGQGRVDQRWRWIFNVCLGNGKLLEQGPVLCDEIVQQLSHPEYGLQPHWEDNSKC